MKLWHPPTYIGFQAPVPPPPDYSSPAAVNARIREFCGRAWFAQALADKVWAKTYGEFRAALLARQLDQADEELVAPTAPSPSAPCPVEDWHDSKWRIVRGKDGALTLKRKRKAA